VLVSLLRLPSHVPAPAPPCLCLPAAHPPHPRCVPPSFTQPTTTPTPRTFSRGVPATRGRSPSRRARVPLPSGPHGPPATPTAAWAPLRGCATRCRPPTGPAPPSAPTWSLCSRRSAAGLPPAARAASTARGASGATARTPARAAPGECASGRERVGGRARHTRSLPRVVRGVGLRTPACVCACARFPQPPLALPCCCSFLRRC
jgi:hypothetical protein